jgi:hypothetical protein
MGGWGRRGPFYRSSKSVRRSTDFQSSAPSSLQFPILDCGFRSQIIELKSTPFLPSLLRFSPSVIGRVMCTSAWVTQHGAGWTQAQALTWVARSGGGVVRAA